MAANSRAADEHEDELFQYLSKDARRAGGRLYGLAKDVLYEKATTDTDDGE